MKGDAWSGGCLLPGVPAPGGAWWRPPGTATAADGTHPTGIHSCYQMHYFSYSFITIAFSQFHWLMRLAIVVRSGKVPSTHHGYGILSD